MKVAIAQIKPKLGDIKENIEKHIEYTKKAVEARSQLIIFPELSLTGYFLQDLAPEIAIKENSPILEPLKKLSEDIQIVLGLVEEDENYHIFNTIFFIHKGKVVHKHRKIYLSPYTNEYSFFHTGNSLETISTSIGEVAVLTGEDFLHLSTLYIAWLKEINLLIVPTARFFASNNTSDIYELAGSLYSRLLGTYIVVVNRVGVEDGYVFFGKSFVKDPFGETVLCLPENSEGLEVVEIVPELVRSARISFSIRRYERPEFLLKEVKKFLENEEGKYE